MHHILHFYFKVDKYLPIVKPEGIGGVVSLDELEILAAKLAYSEALRLGSNEMVFLRPRLLVPGSLDPVVELVNLTSED